jgi:iron complex transport system substrate-binding protein
VEGGFVLRRPLALLAATLAAFVVAGAGAFARTAAPLPQRIVSLSPTATESLFAIGAGPQVVAVDNQSDYPKTAPHTSLSGLTPNVEAIASYRPDLVVIGYDPGGLRDALAKLHIRVLMQNAAKTIPDAYAQIEQLGRLTGHSDRASRLVASMKTRIAKLVASVHGLGENLTYYHELDPTLYSVTSQTFIGRVYALFGLKNIADAADQTGSGYPQLSAEYVVAQNPDLIVLADTVCCGQSPKTLAARPGWGSIDAVRTGEIVRLDDSIASRWGPRLVNFVRAVTRALHHMRAQ